MVKIRIKLHYREIWQRLKGIVKNKPLAKENAEATKRVLVLKTNQLRNIIDKVDKIKL